MSIRVIQRGLGLNLWRSTALLCVHLKAGFYRQFIFPSRELVELLICRKYEFGPFEVCLCSATELHP